MVILKNNGSIDIIGLRSYDRQLVIRCLANWVCSGLQHLFRVYSGPGQTRYASVSSSLRQDQLCVALGSCANLASGLRCIEELIRGCHRHAEVHAEVTRPQYITS